MHDFRKLVISHRKPDPREEEIVSELAWHLEKMFMDLRHAGASEEHAFAAVLKAGRDLGRTVRRLRWQREGGLRPWLRTVVLPGLILSLFYGVCNIGLGVYWENPALWLEASLVLVSIALGFCASSFSRELGGRKRTGYGPQCLSFLSRLLPYVSWLSSSLRWNWYGTLNTSDRGQSPGLYPHSSGYCYGMR
jgi:hypothetical protein